MKRNFPAMNPTREQELWQSEQLAKLATPERLNPCVGIFGIGPEGKTCKECVHLMRRGGASKTYLKCSYRRNTHGAATDHKAGWAACAKYREAHGN